MRDNSPGYWVGHPGALLPLPGVKGNLPRRTSRAVSYSVSAAGNMRAYLSARRAPLRVWTVSIPLVHADEIAALYGLIMATDPPYVWVDPWAKVTNLLTPAAAAMLASSPKLPQVGRQPLEGGGFAATGAANPTGDPVRIEPAPVVPGQPVTVSAYLASFVPARVAAVWLDSNGKQVGAPVPSPTVLGADYLRRVHVAGLLPPSGAAAVSIHVEGASVIAYPAVTWTSHLVEFGFGGGCNAALINELDEDVDWASVDADGLRVQSVGFTVTEVG